MTTIKYKLSVDNDDFHDVMLHISSTKDQALNDLTNFAIQHGRGTYLLEFQFNHPDHEIQPWNLLATLQLH